MLTHDLKRPKYKGPFSIDYREWGSYARGVYLTQDASHMGKTRMTQEKESRTRIIAN